MSSFSFSAWASRVIIILGCLAGLWLARQYVLPVLWPFLLAWLISLATRPAVGKLAGQKKLPRSIVSGLLVFLFTGLALFGIVKGCERGAEELGRLIEGLSREDSQGGGFWEGLSGWMTELSSHLPFLRRFSEHPAFDALCEALDTAVRTGARAALEALGERVPSFIVSFLGRLPSVLIFMTSLLLSCYYFTADPVSLPDRLEALLPEDKRRTFFVWRSKCRRAVTGYFKAYVILGVLTFAEMFLGLTILQAPYAFLMALVIALVDFLPLLGAGTVLIPWAVICLVTGQGGTATGLLIIFGIHTLLRQILEPRLVSRELGLPPTVSLVAVYAGWKLLGVGGMILAPLVAMVVKEIYQGRQDRQDRQGCQDRRERQGGTPSKQDPCP